MASALLGEGVESICKVGHTYGILYYTCDRVVMKNMVGRERERDIQLMLGRETLTAKKCGDGQSMGLYGLDVCGLVHL